LKINKFEKLYFEAEGVLYKNFKLNKNKQPEVCNACANFQPCEVNDLGVIEFFAELSLIFLMAYVL
jgi:hypothetical protein